MDHGAETVPNYNDFSLWKKMFLRNFFRNGHQGAKNTKNALTRSIFNISSQSFFSRKAVFKGYRFCKKKFFRNSPPEGRNAKNPKNFINDAISKIFFLNESCDQPESKFTLKHTKKWPPGGQKWKKRLVGSIFIRFWWFLNT